MEPKWVRPAYLYLMSLVGVVVMALGAVGFLLGIVHVASPDLQRQQDPLFRIVSTVLTVADVMIEQAEEEGEVPPEVSQALDEAGDELDSQSRLAGVNALLRGLIILGVGVLIFLFHWRRAERLPGDHPVTTATPPAESLPPSVP